MKKQSLNAIKLRLILIGALLAIVAIGGTLFSYGYSLLSDKAEETSKVATDASSSNTKIQQLNKTKKLLDENSNAIQRASQIVSNSKSYLYQDQIIDDLNRLANKSDIQILDVTFSDASVVGGTASASTATPAASANGAASATPALTGGIKAVSASVRISEKVEYSKMLDFLYSIEQNLTKMSISKVSFRKADGSVNGKPAVSTDQLTIEVYVK